jgi:putative transposase
VKGRKRHLLVDPLGLILAVGVTAASVQDRDGAKPLLDILRHKYWRRRHIWADGASVGPLVDWVRARRARRPIGLEMTKRADALKGLAVTPKRWIVERPFGWFHRDRRLSKDDELLPATAEAIIQVTMIHLMIRRSGRIVSY